MREFLIMRLYGPMASWGDIAVGEQRLSQGHPTKSAVIGILAAAIGIRRDEEEKQQALSKGYSMAVRVDSQGALLRDYHTVQLPPPDRGRTYYTRREETSLPKFAMNTILSQRDYRIDAHYTVALFSDNTKPFTFEQLVNALKTPRYTLYLGRKSCPLAFPLIPKIIKAENLKQAFDQLPIDNELYSASMFSTSDTENDITYYWEGMSREESGLPTQSGAYFQHERRDQVASRRRWQFSSRKEHQLTVKEERK